MFKIFIHESPVLLLNKNFEVWINFIFFIKLS
jgi:hypothetical protein